MLQSSTLCELTCRPSVGADALEACGRGWKVVDGELVPILTDFPVAPDDMWCDVNVREHAQQTYMFLPKEWSSLCHILLVPIAMVTAA